MKQKKITTAAMFAVPAFAALMILNAGIQAAAVDSAAEPEAASHAMGNVVTEDEYVGQPAANKTPRLRAANRSGSALPSQVDLSTSPYFPPIGDQMQVGSCYAWSSTYYQFTYEANKLNGIATTRDTAYSPAFIYNYETSTWGKKGYGSNCTTVYDFLAEHGALRMAEMPYQSTDGEYIYPTNYDYSLSTDTDAMVDALHTRLSGHDAVTIPGTGTPITGPKSEALNQVKQLLNDGKLPVIQIEQFRWNYDYRNALDADGNVTEYRNDRNRSEWVAYRGYKYTNSSGGHEMTVVGYDDSIWFDYNGNGQVEDAELGAFKVANSWGTSYRNDGFIWVMYDALNGESAVSGNWEDDEPGSRIAAFDRGSWMSVNGQRDVNAFYYITVENKDVYYVGQLTVDANEGVSLQIALSRDNPGAKYPSSRSVLSQGRPYEDVPYVGTLAFDYADLCDPIGSYLSGYNWIVTATGDYNSASFRITDDLSRVIADAGALSSSITQAPINLVEGDLNYDGQFTQADIDYLESGAELSTLQRYLADRMPEQPEPPTPPTPDPVESNITAAAEVIASWNGGQIVTVTVKNNGTEPVNGWALRANSFEGEIVSIWGANVMSGNILRSASYNAEIPAGGEVVFGYQVANPTGALPVFTAVTDRADVTANCDVLLDASNAWGNGFVGVITIQNNSDEAIYAWELTVSADGFTISDANGLNLTDNNDGTYTIASANGNIEIAAHGSITLQFTGTLTGTPSITVVSMTAADLG